MGEPPPRRPRWGGAWQPPPPPGHPADHPRTGEAAETELPVPPARSVIAVCSGKGGVGKSTVALNLAVALAEAGERVGLLDADVHAPDIPLMVGLARQRPAGHWTLSRAGGLDRTRLEPVDCYGVWLMSTGFMVAEEQAVAWTADLVSALLNQLIWSTTWGDLDRLVVDLPPGTSDITQAVLRLLPGAAAVLVVTPQDVAHLDCRRLITMLRHSGVRVAGGVENMSGLDCPSCRTHLQVFAPVTPTRSVWSTGLRRLGSVPLVAASSDGAAGTDGVPGVDGDDGREPVVKLAPDSRRAVALRAVAMALTAGEAEDGPG